MVEKTVKVAVYVRVSTQEQAVEGTSLEHQMQQLEAYCEFHGWTIAGRYIDPGYTGTDANRPGLTHLLADAKQGIFQKVIVFRLDRLTRKLRLLLEIEEKLKEYGVSLHSIRETLDTSTAIGRTVFQVLGLVSEWERDTFIERSKAGRLQRYKEGSWGPGNPPYGYDYNRNTKKLEINEAESRIIKRIYEEYSAGKSMHKIAEKLNVEKVPPRNPKKGKGWRNTTVRDILYNPVYKGTQIVNIYQKNSRLPSEIPDTAIQINVPPIVDEKIWEVVQERRKTNKHLQPPRSDNRWLLQGMITCGLCGHGFRTEISHSRRSYGCRGRLKYTHIDDSPRCTSPRLDAEWLENEVWDRIESIINDPNKLEELLTDTVENLKNHVADLTARIKPVDEELTRLAEQKARLADEWVQMNLDQNKYQQLQKKLNQEEARLRAIRTEIDPDQLEELERTQAMFQLWNKQLQSMAWNLEKEDGSKVRTVEKPHRIALSVLGLDDKDLSDVFHFPATKRQLLDLLQVGLVAFDDRVEVKAVFPIETIYIKNQLLRPDYRSGRCPRSR